MNNLIKNISRTTINCSNNSSNLITNCLKRCFTTVEAGELKKGMWIEHKSKPFQIEKVQHQKVAMRGGFIIADIKNIIDNSKSTIKFRSAEDIELLDLGKEDFNFIEKSKDGKSFIFRKIDFNDEEDEDVNCSNSLQLEGYAPYLSLLGNEAEYQFRTYKNNIIDFRGPTQIDLTVQSITDLQNNVVLHFENGRSCKGPHYLKAGDRVQIRLPEEVFLAKL